jgi:predicted SnoaL-like aldol condensation-catalyzing enzyme
MANRNKESAVNFLHMASRGDVREAYSKFVGTNFKHHNPYYEGSAETLMAAMEENARENPSKTLDVKLTIEEGDFVAVHSYIRLKADQPGAAVVHIFRFEEGRIVELWDVGQAVPEQSPNQYGMF